MSKLKDIEKKILEKSKEITGQKGPRIITSWNHDADLPKLESELNDLKAERSFMLDRRESWLPKMLWNILVPIVVSIVVSITTLYISK